MILKKKKFNVSLNSLEMRRHQTLRDVSSWTSSNGKNALIKDLDINHLKNIIAKIDRGELQERLHLLFDLKNELNYRKLKDE